MEVPPGDEAVLFKNRPDILVGRSGISGGFEDDKLALAQIFPDGLRRIEYIAHVRFPVFVQRCGNADDDAVHLLQQGEIRRQRKGGTGNCRQHGRVDMPDVALSLAEHGYLLGIHVKTGDAESRTAKFNHQREPDISQAKNADPGGSGIDFS